MSIELEMHLLRFQIGQLQSESAQQVKETEEWKQQCFTAQKALQVVTEERNKYRERINLLLREKSSLIGAITDLLAWDDECSKSQAENEGRPDPEVSAKYREMRLKLEKLLGLR